MMILTKYLPATNTRGSRIKASFADNSESVTIPYNYALSGVHAHAQAVSVLLVHCGYDKLEFNIESIKNGYAFMASGTYNSMVLGG